MRRIRMLVNLLRHSQLIEEFRPIQKEQRVRSSCQPWMNPQLLKHTKPVSAPSRLCTKTICSRPRISSRHRTIKQRCKFSRTWLISFLRVHGFCMPAQYSSISCQSSSGIMSKWSSQLRSIKSCSAWIRSTRVCCTWLEGGLSIACSFWVSDNF